MKQSKFCKFLSLALALVMVLGLLPVFGAVPAEAAVVDDGISVDQNHFPDLQFRQFVLQKIPGANDYILTREELEAVTYIDCESWKIQDLTGIEYFTNLQTLSCRFNKLKSVDLRYNPELTYVDLCDNQLDWINISQNTKLQSVWLENNKLTNVDVSGNPELTILQAPVNYLADLDVSQNPKLEKLVIGDNDIRSLDLQNNPNLTWVWAYRTPLADLRLPRTETLEELHLNETDLIGLDLSQNSGLYAADVKLENIRRTVPEGFPVSEIPGFDPTKATNLSGGNFDGGTVHFFTNTFSFYYDVGWGEPLYFILDRLELDAFNFPDTNFRNQLKGMNAAGADGVFTVEEANAVTEIDITNYADTPEKVIKDISGVEYFPNLKKLFIETTGLEKVDLSSNAKLEVVNLSSNVLPVINVRRNPALQYLIVRNNQLSCVDLSQNPKLKSLTLGSNQLTQVDLSHNTSLYAMDVSGNQLTELDVSMLPALTDLTCKNNRLTELDLSSNPNLTKLDCQSNQIRKLDLSHNPDVWDLTCKDNALTCLNLENVTALSAENAYVSGQVCTIGDLTPLRVFPGMIESKIANRENGIITSDKKFSFTSYSEPMTYRYDCGNNISMDVTLNRYDPETDVIRIENLSAPIHGYPADYDATTNIPGITVEKVEYFLAIDGRLRPVNQYEGQYGDFGYVRVTLKADGWSNFTKSTLAWWGDRYTDMKILDPNEDQIIQYSFPFDVQLEADKIIDSIVIETAPIKPGETIGLSYLSEHILLKDGYYYDQADPEQELSDVKPWHTYTVELELDAEQGYYLDRTKFRDGNMVTFNGTAPECSVYKPNHAPKLPGFFVTYTFDPVICDKGEHCPAYQFVDVKPKKWYHEAVDFALENGLFSGMNATEFGPDEPMTRSMLAVVIHNFAGQPIPVGGNPFTDVKNGSWYDDPVRWCYENGIVSGMTATTFGPNISITREMLVTILYRYAEMLGKDVTARGDLTAFPDGSKVSKWCKDEVSWAVGVGLLSGDGKTGYLNPNGANGLATRAQVAQVMMSFVRFCDK